MVIRYLSALLIASGVTFALFFLMHILVSNPDVELSDIQQVRFVDVVRTDVEQKPEREERRVEKPPPPEAPPPELDLPQASVSAAASGVGFGLASVSADLDVGGPGLGAPTDGDYLPLVRIEPQYPRRAAERGIEGWVIVELTVTPLGTVENVRVLEADPPGYFERAAEQAAYKFKYKPKVVNGEPIPVEGVQYRFTFELAEAGRR